MTAILLLIAIGVTLPASVIFGVISLERKDRKSRKWLAVPLVHLLILLVWAAVCRQLFWLDEPMARAAGQGNIVEVEYWLDRGASPDGAIDGTPALTLAREAGHEDVVVLLLSRGAHE